MGDVVEDVAFGILPGFLKPEKPDVPEFSGPTAQELEEEAAMEANERRRELARRQGFASTVQTPLGTPSDIGLRRTGLRGE